METVLEQSLIIPVVKFSMNAFEFAKYLGVENHHWGEFGVLNFIDEEDIYLHIAMNREFTKKILQKADKEISLAKPLSLKKEPIGDPFSYERIINKLEKGKIFSIEETLAILYYAIPLVYEEKILEIKKPGSAIIRNVFPTIDKTDEIRAVVIYWEPYNISYFSLNVYEKSEPLSGVNAGSILFTKV